MAQNWNAWGTSWGLSWDGYWGTLDVLPPDTPDYRPRTHPNVKFTRLKEGYALLTGVEGRGGVGTVVARGSIEAQQVVVAASIAGFARTTGARSRTHVGQVTARGSGASVLSGVFCRGKVGALKPTGGAVCYLKSSVSVGATGTISAAGKASCVLYGDEGEGFVGGVSATGFHNPSDEELAYIAYLLTRK